MSKVDDFSRDIDNKQWKMSIDLIGINVDKETDVDEWVTHSYKCFDEFSGLIDFSPFLSSTGRLIEQVTS